MPILPRKPLTRRSPTGATIPAGARFGVSAATDGTRPSGGGIGSSGNYSDDDATESPEDDGSPLRRPRFASPPQYSFISVYNPSTSVYRQRFDEALRNSSDDAQKMWRDGLIQEQLGKRFRASRTLKWHIEPDDPRHPVQKAAAEKYTKLIQAIPRFGHYRLALKERVWYGKAGAQQVWGRKMVNGQQATTVVDHIPVNGDSVGYHFDGTPKIQVASIAEFADAKVQPNLIRDDRGHAILLDSQYWRDIFCIGGFEPHAPDWGREPEMALAMYGYGLRGRLYWTWWLRQEVLGWDLNALERIGSNGMLYGFYPSGDAPAEQKMIEALKQIQRDNVVAFPTMAGANPEEVIKNIPPAQVAYEVMGALVDKLDSIMKRMICGQEVDGGGTEDDHAMAEGTFQSIVGCDAEDEGETLTTDLLGPMVRMNDGTLPFGLKIVVQAERKDVGERTAAIRMLYDMNLPMDREDVYEAVGMSPPRDGANVVQAPQQQPGGPSTAIPGGGGGSDGGPPIPGERGDTGRSAAKNIPVGANANLPRAVRAAGEGGPEAGANVGGSTAAGGKIHNSRDHIDNPGVMIALKIPSAVARKLKLRGGEPANEMHVTLGYLGRLSEIGDNAVNRAQIAVKTVIGNLNSGPISGEVTGLGRFSATESSDNMDVIYAGVDLPSLPEFRQAIVDELDAVGLPPKRNHGFTPHVTLAYIDPAAPSPIKRLPGIPVNFSVVYVVSGDEWIPIPLTLGDESIHNSRDGSTGAAHAPAGGVSIAGTDFKGGEFIPGETMAKATDAERAKVNGHDDDEPGLTPDDIDHDDDDTADDDTDADADDENEGPSDEEKAENLDYWRQSFHEDLNDFRAAKTDEERAKANDVLASNSLDYLDETFQGSVGRHPVLEDFALNELRNFGRKLPTVLPDYDVDDAGVWTENGKPVEAADDSGPIKAEWDEEEGDWDRTQGEDWTREELAPYDNSNEAEAASDLADDGYGREAANLAADILQRHIEFPGDYDDETEMAVDVLKRLMGRD